ncbi:hypothetical protein CYLTODRAFT_419277 [Cylindrobasidium torrendii FP15055 ss-10]|uniref:BRCT domain-containing protein n=1 Tax=Cylindrobasidium torrendii FP15055 ss-10 TaxID=1314674 RepID=A0A0D7BLJ0_9AGAR|nr:hypothetical protein CYLTODRAFT_419277 [Cylindrobasidium torrendii FP15055 ss-10]
MRFRNTTGDPLIIWIADNVTDREASCEFIKDNGGRVVDQATKADLLLVDPDSSQGRNTARNWDGVAGRVVLNSAWLDVCRQEDRVLTAADEWGGWRVPDFLESKRSNIPSPTPAPTTSDSLSSSQSHHAMAATSREPAHSNGAISSQLVTNALPTANYMFPPAGQVPGVVYPGVMPLAIPGMPAMPGMSTMPMPPMDPNAMANMLNSNPQALHLFQMFTAMAHANSIASVPQQPILQPTSVGSAPPPPAVTHDQSSSDMERSDSEISDHKANLNADKAGKRQKSSKARTISKRSSSPEQDAPISHALPKRQGQKPSKIFVRNGTPLAFFIQRDVGNRTHTLNMIQNNGGTIATSVEEADLVVLPLPENKLALCREQIMQAVRQGAPIIKKQWIEDCVEDATQYEPNKYFHAVTGATATIDGFWSLTSNRAGHSQPSSSKPMGKSQSKTKRKKESVSDREEDEMDVMDEEAQEPDIHVSWGKGKGRALASDSGSEGEGEEHYTAPPKMRKKINFSKTPKDSASAPVIPGKLSRPAAASAKQNDFPAWADGLAFPSVPPLTPIRRGNGYLFTPAEMQYAEDYCRVRWTLDPSCPLRVLTEELAGQIPHHSAASWVFRLGQHKYSVSADLFDAIHKMAAKEHYRRNPHGLPAPQILPPKASVSFSPVAITYTERSGSPSEDDDDDDDDDEEDGEYGKEPKSKPHPQPRRQVLKRKLPAEHPIPSADDLPSWASDLVFPSVPTEPPEPSRNPKHLAYSDAELKYAEDLARVCWIVNPDIEMSTICERLAEEMPYHTESSWMAKLKHNKDAWNAIALEALIEHSKRRGEPLSVSKKPRLSTPDGGSSSVPLKAKNEDSVMFEAPEIRRPRGRPPGSSSKKLERPSWAEELKWPTPPLEDQAEVFHKGSNKYKYTDAEMDFAQAWCRNEWMLQPNASHKTLATKLHELVHICYVTLFGEFSCLCRCHGIQWGRG